MLRVEGIENTVSETLPDIQSVSSVGSNIVNFDNQNGSAGNSASSKSATEDGSGSQNGYSKDELMKIMGSYLGDPTSEKYEIHKGTGTIQIEVIDNKTGNVLKEIPPDSILDMVASIWKMVGINVDTKG